MKECDILGCQNIISPHISEHIYLVGERFILKIHQNTTNYSDIVDISVSIRNRHLMKVSDTDHNVKNVRIIGCVLMNF